MSLQEVARLEITDFRIFHKAAYRTIRVAQPWHIFGDCFQLVFPLEKSTSGGCFRMSHYSATQFLRKFEKLRGAFTCLLLKSELLIFSALKNQHQNNNVVAKFNPDIEPKF
jgi:hypothetical protein